MEELKPRIPKDLVFKKQSNFYIVLNPDVPNIMVIDNQGKEILQLCDGSRRIKDIIEHVHNWFSL